MVLEVGLVHHVVYEAGHILDSCCISCRIRTVKGKMEVEVREIPLDLCEVFKIECLDKAAGSIEEVYFATGLQGLEEVHDVASERSHAGTTTDEDIFLRIRIILRKKELTERTGDPDLVTRLAREDIGR